MLWWTANVVDRQKQRQVVMVLEVRFTAPAPPKGPETEGSVKDKDKGKEKDKQKGQSTESTLASLPNHPTEVTGPETLESQAEQQRLKYAARMALMVGGVVRTHQLWFLCTTKAATGKDKKKKK
ncbi:uncharacterized protein LOC126195327 isoform X2 [Schistocerca nitens]|uniref:uncharacterized protein LOC126195327 isoform X2 n=1 Tax=Schistocerca nitens TaxID=7011 RepID=UPI00211873F2|nr:uncharacterized protein LOC126195327 isoform X2 [Schistocerca nitens]